VAGAGLDRSPLPQTKRLADAPQPQKPVLVLDQVSVRFGGIKALDALSLSVAPGEICALIGPNGAGKTTIFNAVSGLCAIESGEIRFAEQTLTHWAPHQAARLGIARTFQNLALFESQTVLFNVLSGMHAVMRCGLLAHALKRRLAAREEAAALDRAWALIESLGLEALARRQVSELSLGLRKRTELARALASEPRLLMLDEPAAGLTLAEQDDLATLLVRLRRDRDLTILLVEHKMRWMQTVCERAVALDFGRTIADGTPAAVSAHPNVVAAWLGRRA
jgi:branched-chain amino acid transport system ATP-binding protein